MTDQSGSYRVLARKYRPADFGELIGQEAMVRTLTNAIASGRLAHAFILTGVRGVGKTTTARIIARALNCTGHGGPNGPTPEPCGACDACTTIAEDRNQDVLEMDAASRTGVDDIRELIDGARYRPVAARYKVYIIDEVHMLSKSAFNALLKTLEEPPEHVKFVFATTEIRRVPLTVLSRCQRFDLRRVDADTLVAHFADIAAREGARVTPNALRLIARAADGSVRDGLSLLDQAIAHVGDDEVGEDAVRDMLGLVDRMQVFDLMDAVLKGDIGTALGIAAEMHDAGADPVAVLQDLLELAHWLTRLKLVPDDDASRAVSDIERRRGRDMAAALAMPALARAWQMLLKGLGEARVAPNAMQAMEMILVRLAFAAELPAPADLVRKLTAAGTTPAAPAPTASDVAPPAQAVAPPTDATATPSDAVTAVNGGAAAPASFEEVVALFEARGELKLLAHLMNDARLIAFALGRIEFAAGPQAPADLAARTAKLLGEWTGAPWEVVAGEAEDAAPLPRQQLDAAERSEREQAVGHPTVQAALETFPGATIEDVRAVRRAPMFDADPIDPDPEDEDSDREPAT